MGKHLFFKSATIFDYAVPFQKVGHIQYMKKRMQFWKYRKKRTMGKSILMLWRAPKKPNKEGKS